MPKSVLLISTLDTKGQETLYLKDKLSAIGLAPVVMDISGRGSDMAGIDPRPGWLRPAAATLKK